MECPSTCERPLAGEAFGPFPDETLLSIVDRILYFFGANNCNCPAPPVCSFTGTAASSTRFSQSEASLACNQGCNPKSTTTHSPCPSRSPSPSKRSCCPKCGPSLDSYQDACCNKNCCRLCGKGKKAFCLRPLTTTPGNKESRLFGGFNPPSEQPSFLKRSFSLCSLACRKVKEKLSFHENPNSNGGEWLWTRVQSQPDGIQVYEMFSNRESPDLHQSSSMTPSNEQSPDYILVILQNGTVVPFETVPNHL